LDLGGCACGWEEELRGAELPATADKGPVFVLDVSPRALGWAGLGRLEWAPDHWRAELSAGYRFIPDLLVKAQCSYSQAAGDPAGFSNHLAGLGIGWRF